MKESNIQPRKRERERIYPWFKLPALRQCKIIQRIFHDELQTRRNAIAGFSKENDSFPTIGSRFPKPIKKTKK